MQRESSITLIEQLVIDKVRELRLEAGLSQYDLAIAMGLSKGFIGDVENPKRRAKYNLNHLEKLTEIFHCSFCDFFPQNNLKTK
ncbi:helix-turn-helix domain-containing protein [Pedobacter agri]|uniref:helix-turn-helix domain-containing protein n=1 Tax=Pedobacter agri TaxID=454586 RepID=UPI002786DDD7|nr:helix-turn-helix transcriptional regulator [Pedobacter agri]MDQ1140098.1 transcriptional regulator with XRE-family HTH domain [Pedobacter agri]